MSSGLPLTIWTLIENVAKVTDRSRLSVLQTMAASAQLPTTRLSLFAGFAESAPFVAKPLLRFQLSRLVARLNADRGANITPKQMDALVAWVMSHTQLIRKVLKARPSNKSNSSNMTKKEWMSFWAILSQEQVIRLAGF